ncbi:L,D-transpeptidase [Roseibium sp. DSM 29163]|uniref:L,D-transpeptidase n=2 Tax=Roseibium salinum TaxID=1604349 RepID=A0ABT3R996_9HYPH|nr:L,D-transpeptidase [Roseibium sp. DSM 29163]MCX2725656.1 L,D-transpeptidase [Roseibium sp. DSM 29163]
MAGAGAVSAHAAGWKVPRSHGPASKQIVSLETGERSGTIIISTQDRTLDVVLDAATVARYSIGVGRDGFTWTGVVKVGHKAEWPSWRPPSEMRAREPGLPEMVPPGPHNPLGARALYLYRNGTDTLYRIHGTNDTGSVGDFVSSGCFRLSNKDVLELYENVKIGTKVIVK